MQDDSRKPDFLLIYDVQITTDRWVPSGSSIKIDLLRQVLRLTIHGGFDPIFNYQVAKKNLIIIENDTEQVKAFGTLEQNGEKMVYLKSRNASEYFKVIKYQKHLQRSRQNMLLKSSEEIELDNWENAFVRWFVTNGFEIPVFVENDEKVDHLGESATSGFKHSDDYSSIIFNGEEYTLTPLQAEAVKILHRNHMNGTPSLTHAYILEEIGYKGKSMKDIFKNSGLWNTLIIWPKKTGVYRLNI